MSQLGSYIDRGGQVHKHRYEDIRKIVIAKTIVDSGSMQKAASALRVTPSAISQSLSTLEKQMGSPLFLREQGKLIPTEKCIELIEKARPALRALDSLFEEKTEPRSCRGKLLIEETGS